jgi:hypothetical protein
MKKLFVALLTATVVSGGMAACSTEPDPPPTQPPLSLVGTWDFIGFSDAGVDAQTAGTWVFRADGTLTIQGTVTFPGEPTDDISGDATYQQTGTTVVLTFGSDTTTWTLMVSATVATLTEVEPPPANTITLRGQP